MGVGVATVTAKIGAGATATTVALTGVSSVKYDFLQETAEFVCDQGNPIFDITAQSTFTMTVSGVTYTVAIS